MAEAVEPGVIDDHHAPASHTNWRAFDSREPLVGTVEFPLFTDSHISGQIETSCGPYQLFNLIAGGSTPGRVRPVLLLRSAIHIPANPKVDMSKTDDARYHGGWIQDEIAALWSLLLGIRLWAGPMSRLFDPEGDRFGRPYAPNLFGREPDRGLFDPSTPRVLPHNCKSCTLVESEGPLSCYPSIDGKQATALVRAARSYQRALWFGEQDANMAWLLLVSAIETVAQSWQPGSPGKMLRNKRPELAEYLREHGGEAVVERVANEFAHLLGSTSRFIKFILAFLPEPPLARPAPQMQCDWSKAGMRKILDRIYDHRSKALHDAKPFPAPMCNAEAPLNGVMPELPMGSAMATAGGVWLAKDVPMLLHTFEYLVRGTLLNWWASLDTGLSQAGVS